MRKILLSTIIQLMAFSGFSQSCVNTYEPNGTLATATIIPLNSSISAAIDNPFDQDLYKFTTNFPTRITVTVSGVIADYINLFIIDSAGTAVISNSLTYGNAINPSEKIILDYQVGGTYYIKVVPSSLGYVTQCYTLKLEVEQYRVCNTISQYEPNETMAAATPLPTYTGTPAISCYKSEGITKKTDVDYYKFTTTVNTSFTATLESLPENYNLYIYNAAGILLDSSVRQGTLNESITVVNKPPGTYYIKVIGKNYAFNQYACYQLGFWTTCEGIYDAPLKWYGNSYGTYNNLVSSSASIPLSTTIYGGFYASNDLVDYYNFVAPAVNQTITVTLNTLGNNATNVELLTGSLTVVGNYTTNLATGIKTVTFTIPSNSFLGFTIKVTGTATACYSLKVTTQSMFSNTLPLNNPTFGAGLLSIYPNPVINVLNITTTEAFTKNDKNFVQIVNAMGRIVLTQTTNNKSRSINVSALPKGIYLLKINNSTTKFIKE